AGRAIFFFQAEDGIRGKLVTGVQTCALPIFARAAEGRAADPRHVPRARREMGLAGIDREGVARPVRRHARVRGRAHPRLGRSRAQLGLSADGVPYLTIQLDPDVDYQIVLELDE